MDLSQKGMQEILLCLQDKLQTDTSLHFMILDPDVAQGYAGSSIIIDNTPYIYRGYKAWTDLAELLKCKMLTPKKSTYPLVNLTFKKLTEETFHTEEKNSEKYGIDSHFSNIHKMEEPAFFYYYHQALMNVKIHTRQRILNLGINKGDEFEVIKQTLDTSTYNKIHFVGVDHSKSVISYAKSRFPENNVRLYVQDINTLDTLQLKKFDLLISIGTLQSPSINFKPFFMHLVQTYLTHDAAIILGFPNSRWLGGEMIYGAKVPNYHMSELGQVLSDIIFCKKYLQQKKYRVRITGKQYLFLTATKIA